MSLKTIIEGFEKELEEKVKAREDAISICRKLITMSKQSVMAVHRDELGKARAKLIEAKKMLGQTDEILKSHRDLSLNIARVAHQEYAEAEILLRLVETEKFPEPEEIGVQKIPYLLGLADSIGEFRRRALESLRRRNLEVAERSLQIMDEIYSELIVLENVYGLAPELRRKCDVARRVIEITIGDIATETGRSSLEKSIEQLEKLIRKNWKLQ
jgi:translin